MIWFPMIEIQWFNNVKKHESNVLHCMEITLSEIRLSPLLFGK
jgi:hypothetical protein